MGAVSMSNFLNMALGLGIVDAGGPERTQVEAPLPYLRLACGQQLVGRGWDFSSLSCAHAAACSFAISSSLPASSRVIALRFCASLLPGLNCRGTCPRRNIS